MRRLRLSTILVSLNVGLLLLAVIGVAAIATRMLQQLADEQALARVSQAGASGLQALHQAETSLETSARLLSERPTLRRLLDAGEVDSLQDFVQQFQLTSGLDGAAVLRDERVLLQSNAALPWETLRAATHSAAGGVISASQTGAAPLILSASAPLVDRAGMRVVVAQHLDQQFAGRLSQQIDLPVQILALDPALRDGDQELRHLRRQVMLTGEAASGRLRSLEVYINIQPLKTSAGEVVGMVETTLPGAGVAASLRQFVRTLVLLTLALAGLAGLISFVLGRRLSVPLQRLSSAADRIGQGDLTTPIIPTRTTEIRTLSVTLDEMRRRLLQLTSDLRRQRAEAQAIVTGIVEGVFTVDRERRIRYLNPQAAAQLGISADQAIGRFCGDVLNPRDVGGVRPCAENCPIVHARFRGDTRAVEHLRLPDGSRKTVVITSAAPVDGQQVQVMRDETEIEAVRRLRDTMLANISHEFRTPLSAQLASIELLLDRLPDLGADQIEQLVISLQRGTLRLTQLIDNLLESVRIESGQDSIRRRQVQLDEVVEDAVGMTRPLFEQRAQEVLIDLPYPLPPIQGDAPRLTQVFVNLLANAHKYAPAHSTIAIGGAVEQDRVLVWVEDEGPGLPPLAEEALFQRFIRSSLEEPEQQGMGLGLWIVKSIVERHGGTIDAQSTGRGTRLEIALPRYDAGGDEGAGAAGRPRAQGPGRPPHNSNALEL